MYQNINKESLLGHPVTLFRLACLRMWGQFAYFGVRGFLLFYLMRNLDLTDASAYQLYGGFAALFVALPFLVGWISDRSLSSHQGTLIGGLLSVLGTLLLASGQSSALYVSLAFIAIGTALLRANLTVWFAQLYDGKGSSKDAGFSLFMLYGEVGAALSSLACGYVGETFGWAWGFGLAALLLLSGLLTVALPLKVVWALVPLQMAAVFYPVYQQSQLGSWFQGTLLVVTGLLCLTLVTEDEPVFGRKKEGESLHQAAGQIATLLAFSTAFLWATQTGAYQGLFKVLGAVVVVGAVAWLVREGLVFLWGASLVHWGGLALYFARFGELEPSAGYWKLNLGLLAWPLAFVLWTLLAKKKSEPGLTQKYLAAYASTALGLLSLYYGWLALALMLLVVGEVILRPAELTAMTSGWSVKAQATSVGAWTTSQSLLSTYLIGFLLSYLSS